MWRGNFWECLANWKAFWSIRFYGVGQKGELCKNGRTDLNDQCIIWRVSWKDVPFRVLLIMLPIQGFKSPKALFLQMWICIFKLNIQIIEATSSISIKFCTIIKATKYSVCGPNVHQMNPRWRLATILQKLPVSATAEPTATKFCTMMHNDLLTCTHI